MFLEVVAAAALVGIVVASVAGAIGFVHAGQLRQRRQLTAAEVANRFMVMYLDELDAAKLPSQGAPQGPFEGDTYRWSLNESTVQVTPAGPEQGATAPVTQAQQRAFGRLKAVQIRVWLSEESGGDSAPRPGVPQASIWRLVDPLAVLSRPDSASKLLQTDEGRRMISELSGVGSGAVPGTPQGGGR